MEIDNGRLIEEIRDLGLPMVSMDYDAYRSAVPSVSFDNLGGGFQATRHLIAQGHRRIVLVRSVSTGLKMRSLIGSHMPLDPVTDDRMRGYGLAMQEADLPALYYEKINPVDRESLNALFARKSAPTALICLSNGLAAEMVEALNDLGYAVPEDVSLIGFGGSLQALAQGHKLSSVWVDTSRLGHDTAQLFLEALAGKPPRRVVLPVRLNLHDSVTRLAPSSLENHLEIEPTPARDLPTVG